MGVELELTWAIRLSFNCLHWIPTSTLVTFYRPQYDEPHPEVTPDGYCDNFMAAVEALLADRIGTST